MDTLRMKGSWQMALMLLAALVVTSCQSPKKISKSISKMSFTADPEVLEVNGDSVTVNITGKFPPNSVPKNALVKFQPILHYGDTMEMPLKVMYLKGEKVKGQEGKTIRYAKGGTFNYTDKFAYQPEMKKASMSMDYNIKLVSKYSDLNQCLAGTADTSFQGTITTSLTVQPTEDIYTLDTIQNEVSGRKVIFYYVVDEGFLRDTAKKGPAMQAVRNIINDSAYVISQVVFHGYASPDGEMDHNIQLTKQRTQSAISLVSTELKRMGVRRIYDSTFLNQPDNGEDWVGLARMVNRANFDGKQDVMNVIMDKTLSPDAKEAKLRTLPAWNTMLVNNLLPKLRRTEITFVGSIPSRDLATLRDMAKDTSSFYDMSKRELIMLANNTSDTSLLLEIYHHLMVRYPDDWAGKNNYAAVLLKSGHTSEANDMFEELHKTYPGNDTITSNLGVAKRWMHNYNGAKDLYTSAQMKGVKENNNLGILYIKYGDYQAATSSFEPNRCDYNVALAYTLKGQYDTALQKVDCIVNKSANDYYLRAIIGARKGDKDLMTTSLTRAIQMDPTLRDRAKEDLEFRKYMNTPEFANAIR
jgi:hypothetical protein